MTTLNNACGGCFTGFPSPLTIRGDRLFAGTTREKAVIPEILRQQDYPESRSNKRLAFIRNRLRR
jgi:hypothetical protein